MIAANTKTDLAIKYKRTHLETGSVYIGEFNTSHGWEFGEDLLDRHNRAAAMRRAYLKKDEWNKQQPDTWRYEICLN